VEANGSSGVPRRPRTGGVGDRRCFVENLDDAFRASRWPRIGSWSAVPGLGWAVELGEVCHEGEQPADGDALIGKLPDREADYQQDTDHLEQLRQWAEQGLPAGWPVIWAVETAEVLFVNLLRSVGFAAVVGADQRIVGEAFFGDGGERACSAAFLPEASLIRREKNRAHSTNPARRAARHSPGAVEVEQPPVNSPTCSRYDTRWARPERTRSSMAPMSPVSRDNTSRAGGFEEALWTVDAGE